jgi:hypothetical protein
MLQNGYWCSVAVQIVSEPEISQGAEFELRADARTLSGAKGGCKNLYESVLSAGAKAKSVTNNLPILSVLVQVALIANQAGSVIGAGYFFFCHLGRSFGFESV